MTNFRVQFTPTARAEYDRLARQAEAKDTGRDLPNLARERLKQTNLAVKLLGTRDPRLDVALEGIFWWVRTFTYETVQLYYQRQLNTRIIQVLYVGNAESAGTYEFFASLVLSGRFNTVMKPLGVSIPESNDLQTSSTIH